MPSRHMQAAVLMNNPLSNLVDLLRLEPIETDVFRGKNSGEPRPRVFGGQVAGQALMAAGATAGDLPAHSLHAYFLRSGDTQAPIDYHVQRVRDGRSFVTRVVDARQHGESIFQMTASFHAVEPGLSHQLAMPEVPPPEQCMSWIEWFAPLAQRFPPEVGKYFVRERPIEIRPIDPIDNVDPKPMGMLQRFWMRASGPLPDEPRLHQAIATYASDHTLLGVAMRPHGRTFMSRDIMAASLDHAMWLHRPLRMDQWILYDQSSPAGAAGRGLAFGHFFAHDGELVASIAQEGLMRLIDPARKSQG